VSSLIRLGHNETKAGAGEGWLPTMILKGVHKMTDRDLLETIIEKIGTMDSRISGIEANMATKQDLAEVKADLTEVKADLTEVKADLTEVKADAEFTKNTVIKIENEHGRKLGILFDGYQQNSEKLDRIEAEVTKHEEVILRRLP